MKFCPSCSNLLLLRNDNGYKLFCNSCPYQSIIKNRMRTRVELKNKEVDDVLGGEGAWDNVEKDLNVMCPKCEHMGPYFFQLQIRSADEPMSTFFKCSKKSCGIRWNEK